MQKPLTKKERKKPKWKAKDVLPSWSCHKGIEAGLFPPLGPCDLTSDSPGPWVPPLSPAQMCLLLPS